MTGSPLLRLALILIALVALAIPLARITARLEAPATPTENSDSARSATRPVTFAITSTSPTASLTLTDARRTLGSDPNAPFTADIPAATTTDIIIRATWPDSATHALRIVATVDSLPLVDRTFWTAADTLEDVLTIPGDPAAEP